MNRAYYVKNRNDNTTWDRANPSDCFRSFLDTISLRNKIIITIDTGNEQTVWKVELDPIQVIINRIEEDADKDDVISMLKDYMRGSESRFFKIPANY